MKIDIVTIVYNDLSGLVKTISSVKKQRELINKFVIIDGGSTDGTVSFVKENMDIVNVFVSEADNGIYDAMNKGWKFCDDDSYVQYLNSGDELLEGGVIELFSQYKPSVDIYHCLIRFNHSDGIYTYQGRSSENLNKAMIEHPTCFVKKEVFKVLGGFDERYKFSADYAFMIDAKSQKFEFKQLPIVMVGFDCTGVSSSNLDAPIESLKVRRDKGIIKPFEFYIKLWYFQFKKVYKML